MRENFGHTVLTAPEYSFKFVTGIRSSCVVVRITSCLKV